MRVGIFALICVLAMPASAQLTFEFPGPSAATFSEDSDFAAHNLPIGPFIDGEIETLIAEGALSRAVWRISNSNGSSLSVIDTLRQQAEQMGFELLFECDTQKCGGFDFRFGIDVVPEPMMHVDLGDFRFLSAQRLGDAVPEYVSLLVSRSAEFAFVQMTRIGSAEPVSLDLNSVEPEKAIRPLPRSVTQEANLAADAIADNLDQNGSVALDDLVFPTGSSQLGRGDFASLEQLATYLTRNPSARIVLVGHTDAVGSLDSNIALSRKRAASVRNRLIRSHNVPSNRISAEGVGFLTPRASNSSDDGRALNRRVEAVLATVK